MNSCKPRKKNYSGCSANLSIIDRRKFQKNRCLDGRQFFAPKPYRNATGFWGLRARDCLALPQRRDVSKHDSGNDASADSAQSPITKWPMARLFHRFKHDADRRWTSSFCPVGVRRPVFASMRNTTRVLESWFAGNQVGARGVDAEAARRLALGGNVLYRRRRPLDRVDGKNRNAVVAAIGAIKELAARMNIQFRAVVVTLVIFGHGRDGFERCSTPRAAS